MFVARCCGPWDCSRDYHGPRLQRARVINETDLCFAILSAVLRSRLSRPIEHYNSMSPRQCVKCTTVNNVVGVLPKSQLSTKWEVIEIVAEDGKLFQVRLAGNDPETGKLWPLDWIPSSYRSAELVKAWERKKGEHAYSYTTWTHSSLIHRITQ